MFQYEDERRPQSVTSPSHGASSGCRDTRASPSGSNDSKSGPSGSGDSRNRPSGSRDRNAVGSGCRDKHKDIGEDRTVRDSNIEDDTHGRQKTGQSKNKIGIYGENQRNGRDLNGNDNVYARDDWRKDLYYKNDEGSKHEEDNHTSKDQNRFSDKLSTHSPQFEEDSYKSEIRDRNKEMFNSSSQNNDRHYEQSYKTQESYPRRENRVKDYFYPRYRSDESHGSTSNEAEERRFENHEVNYVNDRESHDENNYERRLKTPEKCYGNHDSINRKTIEKAHEIRPKSLESCAKEQGGRDCYQGPPCPARRPLPPRPKTESLNMALPSKTTVPLKVWIVASASCLAVCAALVLATVIITKWGTGEEFTTRELYQHPEPIYAPRPIAQVSQTSPDPDIPISESEENINEIEFPILEKLGIFKNIVASRESKRNDRKDFTLASKPQLHPLHETMHHVERKIEKKDQAKYPHQISNAEIDHNRQKTNNIASDIQDNVLGRKLNVRHKSKGVPEFKTKLPDVFNKDISFVREYLSKIRRPDIDYEEYYNDENLYSDYMESNTMTSYLIEKVQELHDWITSDPDFELSTNTTKAKSGKMNNDFGQLLKALNESLIEGNVTIVMNKLKDIYFGENYTHTHHSRKVILSNSTDLLSFGILTLDIMLLHNIQLMAWDNQEQARAKMLKDPDVFAFNALFLEPAKVEAKQNQVNSHHDSVFLKRPLVRAETEQLDLGRNLLEDMLEMGMSTARAAIHLGRAYKNTKIVLNQLSNSNKEALNANIQSQMSRNVDGNTHALQHLQTSFDSSAANITGYTELDCVWLVYCKNLAATAKLNAPYGTMARINGMALRMLTGELAADRALDTMIYEALAGWTDLRCNDMFPRCSHTDAANVVLEAILAPMRKNTASSALLTDTEHKLG